MLLLGAAVCAYKYLKQEEIDFDVFIADLNFT
jgi:hypothetical protein